MALHLQKELAAYGAGEKEVILLGRGCAELVDYLDLLAVRDGVVTAGGKGHALCPDAVIEMEGRPALYVLSVDQLVDDVAFRQRQLLQLRRTIACRGDTAPLAVIQPGQIVLYASDSMIVLPAPVTVSKSDDAAPMLIRDLLAGSDLPANLRHFSLHAQQAADKEAIYDLLFRLLNEVTDQLLGTEFLAARHGDVLSLVGRALFARFLIDRQIINQQTFRSLFSDGNTPENCFANAESAAETCSWLEANFNGELLPLSVKDYHSYFHSFGKSSEAIFAALSKILYRTTDAGQLHLDWGFVDFAHVPVGLLSQVYERYAHKWFPEHAEGESVHYTPHHIANFVVKQAFAGVTTAPKHEAKICDPAAGAGIFLVLAFRQLIAEKWKATGRRPDKADIRKVLYEQIRGFDINEHALKLAALSLYLTALELDPNPFPPNALRFKKLRDLTLIPTRGAGEEFPKFPVLGSLGSAIGSEHNEKYDIVVGNPPWTSWEGDEGRVINATVEQDIRRIASMRNRNGQLDEIVATYHNPDLVPDLPFVWKAMEWAKYDGVISFVLHGRLLFKRARQGADARAAILRALRVTALVNGAGLKSAEVWPGIDQPFCLLFAKNRLPGEDDAFYFLSPERDAGLNAKSIIRLDYQAAQPVEWKVLEREPFLLKTLFLGTPLDANLLERLHGLTVSEDGEKPPMAMRLKDYWTEARGLYSTQGYRVASRCAKAANLIELNGGKLTPKNKGVGFLIDADALPDFDEDTLERTRKPANYLSPLVIVKKAPGQGDDQIRARLAMNTRPVIFNESFFGYSAHGHPLGEDLASYLFLLMNSDLYLYYTLMISSRYGFERRVVLVEDLDEFPIVPIEILPNSFRKQATTLALKFAEGNASRNQLNDWVYEAYRLEPSDRDVIRDTLETRMPYKDSWNAADRQPTDGEVKQFVADLEKHLQPFFALTGETIKTRLVGIKSEAWRFIEVARNQFVSDDLIANGIHRIIETIADKSGASRIVDASEPGHVVIGLLAKYRYWTPTRARLTSTEILRDFGSAFPVPVTQ